MHRPEWPRAEVALHERNRRKPILETIGRINPAASDPQRLSARRVHYFYTGGGGNYPYTDDYKSEHAEIIGTHATTRRKNEAVAMFKQLADELGPIYTGDYSPGAFLLNYLHGFTQITGSLTERNLLLGAMSPLSVEDYRKALNVFPNSHLVVIDNAGFPTKDGDIFASYTSQIQLPNVNFLFADALTPPFQDKSFDTVASNGLFFYLTEEEAVGKKTSESEKRKGLLREVFRTLRPGGVYIGIEPHNKVNPVEYLDVGFSEVTHHPPLMFTSRRHFVDFLRNPNMDSMGIEERMQRGELEYELDMELVLAQK